MKNNFTNYSEALALKELGFDEQCFAFYKNIDKSIVYYSSKPTITQKIIFDNYNGIKALLFQQAFKFFRDKYRMPSWIEEFNGARVSYHFAINPQGQYKWHSLDHKLEYNTYEEAELACLYKLIELCKK